MSARRLVVVAFAATAALAALPAAGAAQDTTRVTAPDTAGAHKRDTTAVPVPGARDTTRADSARGGVALRKHPFMALLQMTAVNVFVNRMDAWVLNAKDPPPVGYYANVTPKSWSANIRKGFVWDTDAFQVNMFMHPFQGAAYFRAGRVNGLNFWESTPLTFLGSLEWEFFGEKSLPSLNDLYNTGFGGIVLGEMTWRLAPLLRDNRARGLGRFVRELAAIPLDPTGFVRRVLNGEAWRSYPNPRGSYPGAFDWVFQGGVQTGVDSGAVVRHTTSGEALVEMSYGDAFVTPYSQPFDVFQARLRVGTGSGGNVKEFRVTGRLWAHELTDTAATTRHILTVMQKLEFESSPAFKFGGQSLNIGLVSGFAAGGGWDLQTSVYGEGILLGAVDAPRSGVAGTDRTYDFGPGAGFTVNASLRFRGFPILRGRWHGAYLHSVSGASADTYTQFPSIEVAVPLTGSFGIGAYGGWYHRRSSYSGQPGESASSPEYRVFLMLHTHVGALPAEPAP
jgi:hypothetical protein